ncbi:MAG: GHKL domain-containing protein [Lunatimonas sp.]|uniref:sensor histidine kinase n=1 Tax=Lunatimonas sp. TaxID=2060141 RepID=UPI00263AF958|nr:ATP-binding protein [Lunatimonas sp.]MCC5938798.1 GHKL domain-containing protein [Lunatimonas sp.]
MTIWNRYYQTVSKNFPEIADKSFSIGYWRDYLFFITILYLIPFSLVAIIPGIVASLVAEFYEIIFFDAVLAVVLYLIGFQKRLSIQAKKVLFILIVYCFAVILFKTLGSYGPGLVYLLAVAVFSIIIFQNKYALYTLSINVVFCFAYGLLIHLDLGGIHAADEDRLLSWFAVSSNFLFLNALFAVLIPRMFLGMQQTLDEQILLKEQLSIEQQKLQESLRLLEKKNDELEQFAYVASHDLQEPLRMISGFLSRIESKYNNVLDEKGKTYIALAVDGADRMRQIILDLLQYARVGAEAHQFEQVNIAAIVDTALKTLQTTIETKQAVISIGPLPVIKSSESHLAQVFQNLIENALKYCPAERIPRVEISHQELENCHQFSVNDNGIGIDKAYFDQIFVIFKRLHDRNSYPGNGIGLAIVKKIVESLNGTIWVESELGKGSTFHFTLKKN